MTALSPHRTLCFVFTCIDSECNRPVKRDCTEASPFSLLLKSQQNIRVGPKGCLQMPVTFAPHEMRSYQLRCTVSMRREDGLTWDELSACQHNGLQQTGCVGSFYHTVWLMMMCVSLLKR